MSRFTIAWRRSALDELAEAWLRAGNRTELTVAVEAVELKLRERPTQCAERQVEGLYLLSEPPLRIAFTIDDASSLVTIVGLGVFRQG
jgi:uncharacterized protein YndB with AHSA1/START domain